jgi:hypothetical protein|tara:strand:- start:385 stop:540 length:156 start_codon:yes stop_codon:yes gene_type:complete
VSYSTSVLKYVDLGLLNDKEFNLKVLQNYKPALEYVEDVLKTDNEVLNIVK